MLGFHYLRLVQIVAVVVISFFVGHAKAMDIASIVRQPLNAKAYDINVLAGAEIAQINNAVFSALPMAVIVDLSPSTISNLPVDVFTASNLKKLSPEQIAGIPATTLAQIVPADISAISPSIVKYLSPDQKDAVKNNSGSTPDQKGAADTPTTSVCGKANGTAKRDWECGPLALLAKVEMTGKGEVLAAPTGAIFVERKLKTLGDSWFTTPNDNPLHKIFDDAVYLVGFVGYTQNFTTTKSASTGQTGTQNNTGFTYGGGLSFGFNDNSFRLGAVIGFDHVASTASYQYNDKPWFSISVGSNF